jgi:hypothetical protein
MNSYALLHHAAGCHNHPMLLALFFAESHVNSVPECHIFPRHRQAHRESAVIVQLRSDEY